MTEYARLVVAVDSTQVSRSTDDLRRFSAESRSAERSVSTLGGTVRTVAAAFGAFKLSQEIGEIVTLASRYQQLGMVMETVGGNVGRSREELDDLEQSLKDTGISALESRSNIVKMISANIDLSKSTELARLAQDAAVVANINSSEAFARLIKGIQSAEKETLETMGLNVNFAQSYAKLAAQLGKNADQLTNAEKVQAGVNAAMEAGANIAGSYEASMSNALKQWQSSTRHLQDFKVALGDSLATEFGAGVENYSNLLKFLGENVDAVSVALRVGLYAAAGRAAVAIGQAATATLTSSAASRAQAAEELRLAQAQAATTAATLQRYGTTWQLTRSTQGLTGAIVAHEAAERRLMAAQAASAGIGRTLLGVMGGPVGLAVTAGMVALSFMDWSDASDEVKRSAVDLSGPLDNLAEKWRALGDSQRVVLQNDLRSSIRDTKNEVQAAVRSVEAAFYDLGNTHNLPFNQWIAPLKEFRAEADRGGQSIHIASQILLEGVGAQSEFRTAVEQAAAKIEEQNAQATKAQEGLRILEEQTRRNVSANNELAASTDTVGLTFVERLKRQADFAGDLTETQKVMISIEKGYAGMLSDIDQQAALTYAGIIDRAAEAARSTKGLSKETKNLVSDYMAVAANMERQVALYGQASEVAKLRYEIESGNLQGLASKQVQYLEGLARELDMKRQLREAEEAGKDYRRTMGEISMGSGGNADLDRLNESYFRRKEIIDAALEAEYLSKEQHDAAILLLDQTTTGARMQILEDYKRSQEQATLQTMSSIISITQTQVQQMQTLVEEGGVIGKAFFLMTQGLAAANSIIQGFQSAMAIRVAYAQMAAMAGPGAPAVLAAGEVHANVAQAMGFATAGMITAQTIQSFEGGGYTGNGPRVGGLDGKGGFMAMVHPRETITDHTKQKSGGGGGAPVIQLNTSVTVETGSGTEEADGRQIGQEAAGAIDAVLMSRIEKESRPGGLLWNLYGGGR